MDKLMATNLQRCSPAQPSATSSSRILSDCTNLSISGGNISSAGRDIVYNLQLETKNVRECNISLMLDWLSPRNFRQIQARTSDSTLNIVPSFLTGNTFKTWLSTPGSVICATGMPACGKTTLVSAAVRHIQESLRAAPHETSVAFVYLRSSDAASATEVVAAIIRQMIEDHLHLLTFLEPLYAQHSLYQTFPEQGELLALLKTLSGKFKRNLRFIDGVDEAHVDHRCEILSTLASINGSLMITSRPLSLLGEVLRGPQVTFLDINARVDDIERMTSKVIDRNSSLRRLLIRHKLKEKVVSTICTKSHGMFLYAALQLNMIKHCTSRKSVLERLQKTPQGLKSIYVESMRRVLAQPHEHAELATRAMLWVAHAERPLHIQELRRAVACDPTSKVFDWSALVDEHELISVCYGLITIQDSSKLVRFCHHTARKALIPLLAKKFPDPHAVLAQGCIVFLDSLRMNAITSEQWLAFDNLLSANPLLGYALRHWSSHLHQSNGMAPLSKRVQLSATRFLASCRSYPLQYGEKKSPFDLATSPIHVAAFMDLIHLLDADSIQGQVNQLTKRGSPPLFLAASQGNHQSLQRLLQQSDIHINARNSLGKTALHAAFLPGIKGLKCVEALLLHPDVNHNARDSTGRTPLMDAADQPNDLDGRHLVLERFVQLAKGAEINAVDRCGDTALTLCMRRGNLLVAEILLQYNGIDTNESETNVPTGWDRAIPMVPSFLSRQ